MRYQLVCLDAGFTLLSPRRTLGDALSGTLAEAGHPVTDDELRTAWEAANRWFVDEYHRPDNDTWGSDTRIEETWRRYHSVMLDAIGFAAPRAGLLDAILASQFSVDAWELYPDVLPALAELTRMDGLRLGVVSDWGSNLPSILSALGLDAYLDFVLASGAVGMAKANPEFYRVALERTGVPASRAVMVGDSHHADVKGARAAGLDALLLARPGDGFPAVEPEADVRIISSLEELPAIVRASAPAQDGLQDD